MSKIDLSQDEKRKILLEQRYLFTEDELCAKWNISKYQLGVWKKELDYPYLWGDLREMIIAALHQRANDVSLIIDYLDYWNHCRYEEREIIGLLKKLEEEGIAKAKDDLWFYNEAHSKNGSSFIF